ncbi:MAG: hypothetical protein IJ509_03980 [Bacilli bacterium]|nr:hypothetical protein [Bacilli bacterium]
MDDKKLRKISKKELLELLLSQAKRIEELEQELDMAIKKLDSREIIINEVGSLAEASMRLNEIFEVAQKTADQYMYNIEKRCQKLEADTEAKCQMRETKADEYVLEAEEKVKSLSKKRGRKDKNTDKDVTKRSKVKGKTGKRIKGKES